MIRNVASEGVEKLVNLAADNQRKVTDMFQSKALYGPDMDYIATVLIHRGIFLENLPILPKISRDSWKIYSYIHNNSQSNQEHHSMTGYFNECLIKLVESQPMKSYLRLSFRQVLNYILSRNNNILLLDSSYLTSYVNEIRTSYNTLCSEDRQVLKPTTRLVDGPTFLHDANEDASFLICWSIIEAAKYCICNKFSPDMPANDFLNLLKREILAPVALGDKASRRFLINLLQNLDKFILDRSSESSTGKHTFRSSNSIEQFYKTNCSIFKSWISKNRQNISRLSLISDEPAECWRNANLRLYLDLEAKFYGANLPNGDVSFSQTLMSLDTKNWYTNLSLIALSAKELGDTSLLYGLQALIDLRGVICQYPPLPAIISNLEGRFQDTYETLKDCKDLDDQSIVEFLDSCIELNILEHNTNYIDRLKSNRMKGLYRNYLNSKISIQDEPSDLKLEKVEQWLRTWSNVESDTNNVTTSAQSTRGYMNLIIPTYLNIISTPSKNHIQDEYPKLIEKAEWLISQDFISQCLFSPNYINKNIKVYHVLIELLKDAEKLDDNLIQIHANDLYWNHLLYRHLCDTNLIDKLRTTDRTLDLIKLRAAKYNQKHNNTILATKIAEDLLNNTKSPDIKMQSSLLLIKDELPLEQKYDRLYKIAGEVSISNHSSKQESILKVLRHVIRLPNTKQASQMVDAIAENFLGRNHEDFENDEPIVSWKDLTESSSFTSKTKTLILFSKLRNEQLEKQSKSEQSLNDTFELDVKLLDLLCESNLKKHKSSALECAARILRHIVSYHSELTSQNLDYFNSDKFIKSTVKIWVMLKTNLISLIIYQDNINLNWRSALINVVKIIGQECPNLLIYSIIVNRLDMQNELVYLSDDSMLDAQEPCSLLLRNNCNSDAKKKSWKVQDCKRKLALWNELLDHIKTCTTLENKWSDIVLETERFLKEIRKISFLCGEYFRTLTIRIPKKLNNFLDYFSKSCDTKTGAILSSKCLEECEKKLKNVCDEALNPIKILSNYGNRIGESHMTKYDIWFCETFSKHLRELEYRLNLLIKKKPLTLDPIQMLVKSITELLAVCRSTIQQFNQNNRQKLYMELISPMLSRLEPSLIPMPGCCNEFTNVSKSVVTIHKISQTINLIVSKTSPKKLKFTGSDGVCRSFLLKAHEDLRLDQLVMDLFASMNNLLLGSKETQSKNKLRRYSVTPVSSRSGLIQWIEAPSLCSSYRTWLGGPNGKKVIEELYATTCDSLCEEYRSEPVSAHPHCQPPQNIQTVDLFYQLLWAKTKPTKHPAAQTRPFFGNIIKYRSEFDLSIFQSIVEQLVERMPNELVANQLWYKSNNSHSYWLKTQEFIHSCATISIVGYVIGLGDRHPENILLDYSTGQVIHIDYNICFDLGKTLSIPEQVPFRLTQNMIHAFGFAGLEGGFTSSCRNVLNVLKNSRSTLLHLMDPVNLSFMIEQSIKSDDSKETLKVEYHKTAFLNKKSAKYNSRTRSMPSTTKPSLMELDMCSQESVELNQPVRCVSDLLDHSLIPTKQQQSPLVSDQHNEIVKPCIKIQDSFPSFDLQHNIKTPTKILAKTATNIRERIKDKLSGTDECIRHHKFGQDCNEKRVTSSKLLDISDEPGASSSQGIDLIVLNDAQSTEDQVDALIIEATSIKNKAAMFEGWMPWI